MIKITLNELQDKLADYINDTALNHKTLLIQGHAGNAVMISEDDWNSINDILQVVSMSGIAESLREGLQETIDQTAENID
ncbi:Antitoxin component YafN of the YafNO toxin-antitoxin module, PHD/YefM family [Oceanospirillum multiglobuliferum]|uniref:Antitoxin n=1 Tax=Oceanospirillum multiglobuliferum TaxID=64969 RepID=A0A1T4MLE3_9GAMM|nr:type II toxin-antitoxin system Phd/YefM family antitoxin [Oceanospirillum multiglobuliferum]OPX56978.1 hypothetical protein BTE48_00635 [Oceanospirillum multiglobuliferum]SJZ67701.1 Antitoxin component YafN of the YafNO toxin-antitoxin module, PHD/YefM family [Oceanospirillum multiglobuliferum]